MHCMLMDLLHGFEVLNINSAQWQARYAPTIPQSENVKSDISKASTD